MSIKKSGVLFLVFSISCVPALDRAFAKVEENLRPAIVSPTHPKDSRGETVYESTTATEKEQAEIPGNLKQASPIKLPPAKYCKALEGAHLATDVVIEGIIAQKGDFIDASAIGQTNPDLEKCALATVARYRFHPATLNGKPVATPGKVVIHFQMF